VNKRLAKVEGESSNWKKRYIVLSLKYDQLRKEK
jgi:hypothetical protein